MTQLSPQSAGTSAFVPDGKRASCNSFPHVQQYKTGLLHRYLGRVAGIKSAECSRTPHKTSTQSSVKEIAAGLSKRSILASDEKSLVLSGPLHPWREGRTASNSVEQMLRILCVHDTISAREIMFMPSRRSQHQHLSRHKTGAEPA
jgi:predicted amidophosphoribosyltransferase